MSSVLSPNGRKRGGRLEFSNAAAGLYSFPMPISSQPANAFIGHTKPPTDAELSKALGIAKKLWVELVADLTADGVDVQEWGSSSKKLGWSLRVKRKDRVIVYLARFQGYFRASFALGDKAVQAACQSDLPQLVIKIIDEARRYAEGTAVRLDVKTAKDVTVVRKLAMIKLAN